MLLSNFTLEENNIRVLPKIRDYSYWNPCIYDYILDYINKKYEINIGMQYCGMAFVSRELEHFNLNLENEDARNCIFFYSIFKKTVIHCDEKFKKYNYNLFPYLQVWHDTVNNNVFVLAEKNKIQQREGDENKRKIYGIFLTYLNIVLNNLNDVEHADWLAERVVGEVELRSLASAIVSDNIDAQIEWLKKYYSNETNEDEINNKIKEFFDSMQKTRLIQEKKNLERLITSFNNVILQYTNLQNEIDTQNAIIEGLEIHKNNDIGESLTTALKSTNNAKVMKVDEGTLTIKTWNYLTSVDPEKAQSVIDNENSFLYSIPNKSWSNVNRKRITKELFCTDEPRFKVKVCAFFTINEYKQIIAERKPPQSYYDDNELPNPHLVYHSCMGSNSMQIADALNKGQMDDLLWMIIGITANMNITETVTSEKFYRALFENDAPACIYDTENDVYVTPKRMIELLEENND